jgi:hypothetical protein
MGKPKFKPGDLAVIRGRDIVEVVSSTKDGRRQPMQTIRYMGPHDNPPDAEPWKSATEVAPGQIAIYPTYLQSLDLYRPGGVQRGQIDYMIRRLADIRAVASWIDGWDIAQRHGDSA